jgi:hypothetical protein
LVSEPEILSITSSSIVRLRYIVRLRLSSIPTDTLRVSCKRPAPRDLVLAVRSMLSLELLPLRLGPSKSVLQGRSG